MNNRDGVTSIVGAVRTKPQRIEPRGPEPFLTEDAERDIEFLRYNAPSVVEHRCRVDKPFRDRLASLAGWLVEKAAPIVDAAIKAHLDAKR